jgi:hypothetical protein
MNIRPNSWLADWLHAVAVRLMPIEHREWAEAMRAEAAHLPRAAALNWAFGCLFVAIKQRFVLMNTGTLRINRWVMLIEVLGCFGPATLAWWEFTFGPSGVARLDGNLVDRVFLNNPGGGWILGLMIGFAFTGLVAPIGAFLGVRYVWRGRALDNRPLGYALITLPLLQTLAGIIGLMVLPDDQFAGNPALFVLMTVLPVAGVVHLMYLARPATSMPRDARLRAG